MRKLLLASILACGVSNAAMAQMVVGDAWARATAPTQTVGGIFMAIHDHGPDDKLLRASSPISASMELHETVADGDVMKMRAVPVLPIESGQVVELKPGSYHLMAMGLKQQLKPGDTFPVTLTFAQAGEIIVTATVGNAGSSGPAHRVMDDTHTHAMDHGSMHGMSK
jgi:copper(I)-binding protein